MKNNFKYTGGNRKSNIKREYLKHRKDNNILECCDNNECILNKIEPVWNNKSLNLILDHINGVNTDNRLKNLRLLCPNCNSQLDTAGGKNRGAVEKSDGGFCIKDKDGHRHYVMPAEYGEFSLTSNKIKVLIKKWFEN